MKTYDKSKVIEVLREIFNHFNTTRGTAIPWFVIFMQERYGYKNKQNTENNEILKLELAKNLIDKLLLENEVTLKPEEIEYFLINREEKTINKDILDIFRMLETDMTDVSFDDVDLGWLNFTGLENVTINLDKLVNKNLTNSTFKKVKFTGSFDDARIVCTHFKECESENAINPQKLAYKSMERCNVGGIEINGSLDGINIEGTDFSSAKGIIRINPQKCRNKDLYGIRFNNCYIVGDQIPGTDKYEEPSFKGCSITECNFMGVKNDVTINLDELKCGEEYYAPDDAKMYNSNITGVTLKGNVKEEEANLLSRCYIFDIDSRYYINLGEPTSYENFDNIQINVIPKEKPKTKNKFWDFFHNNKKQKAE